MKPIVLVAVLTALLATSVVTAAPPPDRIHYQGVLRDSSDNPLDGSHDMVFRFFDADVGGNEILVDSHDAVGGNAVTVTGGLFGVDLGAGVVSDGSGPGTYTSLADVFRDHSATWVSIEVDGEVLSPRVEVISAAYALNADHLDGMDSTSFLTSETDPQVGAIGTDKVAKWNGTALVSSTLTDVSGKVGIGTLTPSATLDVVGSVNASGNLQIGGDLDVAGNDITFGAPDVSLQASGTGLTIVAGTFSSNTLELFSGGVDGFRGELRIGTDFEAEARRFHFRNYQTAQDAVVIDAGTGSLMIDQKLCVGRGFDGTSCSFNAIGNGTNEIPVGSQGLYISQVLEVDSSVYFSGSIHVDDGEISQDHQQWIYFYDNGSDQAEWLQWDPAPDRFRLTDDLKLDASFIEGRDAGNFEIISTSSLHLQANAHVRTMIDDDANSSSARAYWYSNGLYNTTGQIADLHENGNFRIGGTLSQNVAFDIAESFLASEPLEPGDVVRLDPDRAGAVNLSTGADDTFVLGVISSKPGVLLGSAPFDPASLRKVWGDEIADDFEASRDQLRSAVVASYPEIGVQLDTQRNLEADHATRALETTGLAAVAATEDRITLSEKEIQTRRAELEDNIESLSLEHFFEERFVPVALAGRVSVKVDASFAPIRPGDALSPGPTPGVAVRSDGTGPVIGTALEGMTEGLSKVLAFVHRGSNVGSAQIEKVQLQLTADLQKRTPDPVTGTQTMSGNLQVVLDTAADQHSRFSIFRDGDRAASLGSEVFRVDEEGNVFARGSFRPSSMDLAEYFRVDEPVEPGDVLAVDLEHPGLYRRAMSAGDPAVVGIVSEEPGVLLGSGMQQVAAGSPFLAEQLDDARHRGDTDEEARIWQEMENEFRRTHAAVALSGTVPIKVDAGYGAIRPGDLLMSSPTPGYAMRADDPAPGTILGKALESLEAGSGRIRMLVMLR